MWQDAIASALLAAVHKEAGLSLEPLLILVAALARDLQADFLPFVPRLAAALTELVEQGAHILMAAPSDVPQACLYIPVLVSARICQVAIKCIMARSSCSSYKASGFVPWLFDRTANEIANLSSAGSWEYGMCRQLVGQTLISLCHGCRRGQGTGAAAAHLQLPVQRPEAPRAVAGGRHAQGAAADGQAALPQRAPCAPAGGPVHGLPTQACQRQGAQGRRAHHLCRSCAALSPDIPDWLHTLAWVHVQRNVTAQVLEALTYLSCWEVSKDTTLRE